MTTIALIDSPDGRAKAEPSALRALARVEATRHLSGLPLWVGLLLCAFFTWNVTQVDWQAGVYRALPAAITPFAAAIFVAGVRSGGRDDHADLPPLAEESALDGGDRVRARLLGMAPLVIIGSLLVAAAAVGMRLEGGLWVGDEPGRTDSALHTLPEIMQPILLLVLAAVAGVAAGRTFKRRAPIAVAGVVVLLAVGGISWAWQGVPARYATLVQTQPIEVQVGPATVDPTTFPDEWLLSAPDQYDADWDRVIVHQPMAAWHDVYLAGLIIAAAAVALRGRKARRILAAGVAIAVLGVAAQVAVAPDSPSSTAAAAIQAAP